MQAILLTLILLALIPIGSSACAEEPDAAPMLAKGPTSVRLTERGAHLAEEFDGTEVNTAVWRIWQMDPERTTFGITNGRFEIEGRNEIAHNGLWQLNGAKYKDVVLVARMDSDAGGGPSHDLLLHLCGGEMPKSPDHWVEVAMADHGDTAQFRVIAALPKDVFKQADKVITLPRTGKEGFLVRLELDGVANLCTPSVKSGEGWLPITEPIELLLRTTHCEVKMRSNYGVKGDSTTRGWFDDVRIYPRAQSHPVLLRLVTPDGNHPWSRGVGGNEWPPVINIAGKGERSIEDLVIELRTTDGKIVSSVQSANMGHYMLPVVHPDWDVFPVAAEVRILLDGKLLGQPVRIEKNGLAGLYPDDVWDIVVE